MKKLPYLIEFISFALLIYFFTDIYWTFAIMGLILSYVILIQKTSKIEGFKIFSFVIGFVALLIGGGVIVERNFGEPAAFIWIILCLILFAFSISKLRSKIPTIKLSDDFDKVVHKSPGDTRKD